MVDFIFSLLFLFDCGTIFRLDLTAEIWCETEILNR